MRPLSLRIFSENDLFSTQRVSEGLVDVPMISFPDSDVELGFSRFPDYLPIVEDTPA